MDDLQIKAIALNAACVRFAGLPEIGNAFEVDRVIFLATWFEKYLKGQKNDN